MSKYQYENTEKFAKYFRALANPHRLKIFIKLVTCCPPGTKCSPTDSMKTCVGELGKDLDLAAATISHHIKELHQAGLLRMERSGQHIECWVDRETFRELSGFFTNCGKGLLSAEMLSLTSERKESLKL